MHRAGLFSVNHSLLDPILDAVSGAVQEPGRIATAGEGTVAIESATSPDIGTIPGFHQIIKDMADLIQQCAEDAALKWTTWSIIIPDTLREGWQQDRLTRLGFYLGDRTSE